MVLWRGGCFGIHSVKLRTIPFVFVVEGSFNEVRDPECPRGVLLGMNLLISLAMVKHERCYCRKSRQPRAACGLVLPWIKIPPVTLISGTTDAAVSRPGRSGR